MAFRKLYNILADSPVGFQTFNQAGTNLDEMRTQMFVGHGDHEPEGGTPPGAVDFSRLGRHDLQEIARTVGNAQMLLQPNATYSAFLGWTGQGVPGIIRFSTGVYYLPVVGLLQWYAVPASCADVSTTYLPPQMRSFYPSTTNGNNSGIWVNAYGLSAGDFVPVDSPFSFALYGIAP